MANPRMQKGAPSLNPLGRGVNKAKQAPGVIGVTAYGGYVAAGEAHSDLTGAKKWLTYANAANKPVVATGLRYFANLLAGTTWHCEPNKRGGAAAERGAEIVREGLLESAMLKPWPQIVRKAAMYRPLGFSLHATAMRRRRDGLVVYSAIEHRPQHTIEKWLRDDETMPFHAVVQRARESGREIEIPLDECFYCVDDTLTDNPDGVGLLRHVIEYVRRLGVFEDLEGKACVEDMGGTPMARAPLSKIARTAGTDSPDEIKAKTDAATSVLRNQMEKRNKSPEIAQYIMLDSALQANPDGSLAGEHEWSLEIMKSETPGLAYLDVPIRRVELQIARVLGTEWTLMGADGKGSYAQHEDKTSMFATNLQTTLNELGWFATMQLGRRLVAVNGLDPDTATPTLRAEPISTEAIEVATRALANLSMAGLSPDDPARNVIRSRLRLPPEPEPAADLMAPRPGALEVEDVAEGDDPTGAEDVDAPAGESAKLPAAGAKNKQEH